MKDIAEYWDRMGFITADSDPTEEYEVYLKSMEQLRNDEDDWDFTLQDFVDYIDSMKKGG